MWRLASLEKVLPHWLEQTQLLWVQWIYAFWQFIRSTPLGLLALSFLPFHVRQKLKEKTVVVLGETKDIDTDGYEELDDYLLHHQIKDIEVVSREQHHGMNPCYTVKHKGYYYIAHGLIIRQLAKCWILFGENVIFVDRVLPVTGTLAVGRLLSRTEAYEKLLADAALLSKGLKYVVPTCIDYVDYSSKFWGILSTIPILLQAKGYDKSSTLLSLLIILLDFFRGPLYRLYDELFNCFTRFVKLNIFKKRIYLYEFFSIFSSRWGYSDIAKKYAYVAQPGEEMKIFWKTKLRSPKDIDIVEWGAWYHERKEGNTAMRIVPDRWFVMGHDDTSFILENSVQVLSKYDDRQMYYVRRNSELVEQNMVHSYGMAYGGGGFAISYSLAKALAKV